MRQIRIQDIIKNNFDISYFLIENESHQHSVPVNSETHFKLVLVSKDFVGQNLVTRQRKVNQLLFNEFQKGLHALALHTFTPEEFEDKKGQYPDSPDCMGGSKK